MDVAIWSDYLCPWCYLGQRRATRLAERHGAVVTWLPYELHPEIRDGGMTVATAYGKGDDEVAARAMSRFAAMASVEGLPFAAPERVRPTRRAHQTALVVQRQAPEGFESFHRDLFDAIWVRDDDIEDIGVLATLAGRHGADTTEVERVLARDELLPAIGASMLSAVEWGVTGTPAYLFEGAFVLPGFQDEEVFDRIVDRLANQSASS